MFAVAALAACTTEQTIVAPQNEAIGFDTFVDNSTRATDITKDNLTEFGVYASIENASGAALILTNERVYNDGGWKYNNTQYWVPQANYEFTAFAPRTNADITPAVTAHWTYAPTTADGKTTADNGVVTFNNESATADQDFIFAAADRDMTNVAALESQPEKVSFTFAHELSKIAFKFNNGFIAANNITLRVYNVKAAGLVSEATENIASGVASEWTKKGDATFERTFGAQAQADATVIEALNNYTTDHHYFIPVAGTQYTITFDVDLIQAGVTVDTYHHTINTIPTLAKGSNYMFTTTLDASNVSDDPSQQLYPIEFTVNDVEDWRDNGSVALTEPVEVATADALKAAIAEGKSVKLAADITLAEPLQITKNANAIVDLNGKTITAALKQEGRHHYAIDNYGTLTLAGEGAINARGIENFGTMTINGNITITNVDTNGGSTIWNEGNLVINGGTFTTNAQAGAGSYGGALYTEEGHRAVINGGTFIANSQLTYAICNYGETIINDAVVKGKHGAVAADSGAVTVIKGGSFELMENPGVSDHCAYYVSDIKGGKFTLGKNTDSGAQVFYESTIAEGYTVEQNGDWYIVK